MRATSLFLMLVVTGACPAKGSSQQQSAADRFDQYMRGDSSPAAAAPQPRPAQQPPASAPGRRSGTLLGQQPGSSSGGRYVMRWAKLVDQSGFEHPMEAGSVLIPSDWKFDGRVQWGPATGCTPQSRRYSRVHSSVRCACEQAAPLPAASQIHSP